MYIESIYYYWMMNVFYATAVDRFIPVRNSNDVAMLVVQQIENEIMAGTS